MSAGSVGQAGTLIFREAGGVKETYHFDSFDCAQDRWIGSARALTNAAQTVIATWNYEALSTVVNIQTPKQLLDRAREVARLQHYSYKTEQAYVRSGTITPNSSNSHTLDNIPFVLVGHGLDFAMGRSLKFPRVPHNRLLLSLAHGFGHRLEKFGNPDFCGGGQLNLS